MNILLRIFLTFIAGVCTLGLVYFTFVAPNYLGDTIEYKINTAETLYIQGDFSATQKNETSLFTQQKLSMADFVYFKTGSVNQKDEVISIEPGIYFFDFNELNTTKKVIHNNVEIIPQGPGSFVLNVSKSRDVRVFTISGKINLNLLQSKDNSIATTVEMYPNMYYIGQPNEHRGLVNADLKKITIISQFDSLGGNIYFHPILKDANGKAITDPNTGQLQVDTQSLQLNSILFKNIFDSNEIYENFILNIYKYKEKLLKENQEIFKKLSQKQYYNFPGEEYIQDYFQYFLNDEKKKYYYKNLILKKLINFSNGEGNTKDFQYIEEKLKELKNISPEEFTQMGEVITYYYKNILLTQKSNTNVILTFSKLHEKILDTQGVFPYESLITLHSIYENKISQNPRNFHANLLNFAQKYSDELDMNVYDGEHKNFTYFLYFIKNILLQESGNTQDYNSFVQIFEIYTNISSDFISQSDNIEIRTEIYNNIELIEVFTQIIREAFFEKQRNDRNLLILNTQPKINNKNYQILRTSLKQLTQFYNENKYIIDSDESTISAKAKQVVKRYKKSIDQLDEYYLAIDNYTEYEFKYDTAIGNIKFPGGEDQELTIENAKKYLYQFQGAITQTAQIKIRDYPYCIDPQNGVDNGVDPYCYEIEKIEIDGILFSFILIPSKRNQITSIRYTSPNGEFIESTNTHILDDIQENWKEKYETSQSVDRSKYDFSKFFSNSYGTRKQTQNNQEEEKTLPIPPNIDEPIAVQTLKRSLLSDKAPLKGIQNIMKITYKYLIIERIEGEYQARIFPSSFAINYETKGSGKERLEGLFEGKYHYNDANNHKFSEMSVQIIDHNERSTLKYLFDENKIALKGEINIEQLNEKLQQLGQDINMMKYFYSEISLRYKNTNINISLDLNTNDLIFEYDENKKVIINDKGQASKFIGTKKVINNVRYSQLDL